MCATCGCGNHDHHHDHDVPAGSSHLHLRAAGISAAQTEDIRRELYGLPGILEVHTHDDSEVIGISYQNGVTGLTDIVMVFEKRGLKVTI
ncbi:MAG: hypothetical protein Q4D07_10075 [Selenomonadaceae bacterium]|nr:hypothetical protein [Selenomonadaceae bacterium]